MKRLVLCLGLLCLPCLLGSCGLLGKLLQGPGRTLKAAGRTLSDAGGSSRSPAEPGVAHAEVAIRFSESN